MCDKLDNKNINIIETTNTITHKHVNNLAAADSGTLGHFLKSNIPCVNKNIATNPRGIPIPDGYIIYSSHTDLLPQDTLPIEAQYAHIFPDLKKKALLSIGMFYDNGCITIFDNKKVHIINKKTNKHIMHVTRDNQTSLYKVRLKHELFENMTEVNNPERHFAGSLYESKSKADLCTFLHLALWSPCTSTLISAIKNNFLSKCPGLTKQLVQKFLQKSEATAKVHI